MLHLVHLTETPLAQKIHQLVAVVEYSMRLEAAPFLIPDPLEVPVTAQSGDHDVPSVTCSSQLVPRDTP